HREWPDHFAVRAVEHDASIIPRLCRLDKLETPIFVTSHVPGSWEALATPGRMTIHPARQNGQKATDYTRLLGREYCCSELLENIGIENQLVAPKSRSIAHFAVQFGLGSGSFNTDQQFGVLLRGQSGMKGDASRAVAHEQLQGSFHAWNPPCDQPKLH